MVGEQRQRVVPGGVRARSREVQARAHPAGHAHVLRHHAAARHARASLRAQRAQLQPERLRRTARPDDHTQPCHLTCTLITAIPPMFNEDTF